jgi:hypothetical protein
MLAAAVSKESELKGSEKVFSTQSAKDTIKRLAEGD